MNRTHIITRHHFKAFIKKRDGVEEFSESSPKRDIHHKLKPCGHVYFVSRFKASPQEFPSRGMWFSGDLGTKPDVNLHMSMEYRNALPCETWKLVSSLKSTYIF